MKIFIHKFNVNIKGCTYLDAFVNPVEATLTSEWTSAMMAMGGGVEEAVQHVVLS